MLENIKLLLNVTDDKHDNIILLYMSKVETMVVDYCNVNELCLGLESFIEDKVVSIMKPTITGGAQNTGEIKSITRGDTKIEYNVGEAVQTSSNGVNLTDSDKKILNTYRKVRCF
ncbi:MAG: phage head-tail connector protein [Peptostreptococcaceae bacterium]|nr:phage head-tail connector protein [Peptostreptococcaceae bacterium]